MLVDAAAHPVVVQTNELRDYMAEPWRSRGLPTAVDRELLRPTMPWYVADSLPAAGGLPGSDPELLRRTLLGEGKADYAILVPLTRGLVPDVRREAAIATATNEWLAATWLSTHNPDGRFKGSIRVSPRNPDEAVAQIERWAGHPHFVQVAVPLQAHMPYGRQEYMPIWEAANRHHLPVAVLHDGGGMGVELAPTAVGYPTNYIEAFSMRPFNATIHLASLICEGVFEQLEDLVFVFGDGGFDAMWPLLWRLDKDWKASRSDFPWTQRQPSHYLPDHVRFVFNRWDGPPEQAALGEVLDIWDGADLVMYGSNYPHWDHFPSAEAIELLPDAVRDRVMGGNAARLYGLSEHAGSGLSISEEVR